MTMKEILLMEDQVHDLKIVNHYLHILDCNGGNLEL